MGWIQKNLSPGTRTAKSSTEVEEARRKQEAKGTTSLLEPNLGPQAPVEAPKTEEKAVTEKKSSVQPSKPRPRRASKPDFVC
jgi:hypothetical protein